MHLILTSFLLLLCSAADLDAGTPGLHHGK